MRIGHDGTLPDRSHLARTWIDAYLDKDVVCGSVIKRRSDVGLTIFCQQS